MIDFSNEATLYNRGARIPIDTQGEYEDAWRAVQQVYSAQGMSADGDALGDMESRIRDGQSLEQVIAGAYDDAKRRSGNAGRSDATDTSRDAQANAGAQYVAPTNLVSQIVSSVVTPQPRNAALAVTPQPLVSTLYNRTALTGPASPNFYGAMNGGGAPGATPMGGGLMSGGVGTWLLLGGAALLLFVFGRKYL